MHTTPSEDHKTTQDPKAMLHESLVLLGTLHETLSTLVRDLKDGQTGQLAAIGPTQTELEIALKRAFEMERKFNEWQHKDRGGPVASANPIDFDRARHEIGCRLARLRACCRSG